VLRQRSPSGLIREGSTSDYCNQKFGRALNVLSACQNYERINLPARWVDIGLGLAWFVESGLLRIEYEGQGSRYHCDVLASWSEGEGDVRQMTDVKQDSSRAFHPQTTNRL
jgi:hypothetical protein